MDRRGDVTEVDGPSPAPTAEVAALAVGDTLTCGRCRMAVRVTAAPQSAPSFPKPVVCQCGGKMA